MAFTTTTCSCGVDEYSLLHFGSSAMSMAGLAGALPENLTWPEIVAVPMAPLEATAGAAEGEPGGVPIPSPNDTFSPLPHARTNTRSPDPVTAAQSGCTHGCSLMSRRGGKDDTSDTTWGDG